MSNFRYLFSSFRLGSLGSGKGEETLASPRRDDANEATSEYHSEVA